jgi:hypothetical protein
VLRDLWAFGLGWGVLSRYDMCCTGEHKAAVMRRGVGGGKRRLCSHACTGLQDRRRAGLLRSRRGMLCH